MHIFHASDSPFRPADPHSFVGAARTKLLASDEEHVNVHVYHVQFPDGARTNWHTHSGPQWLLVVEGRTKLNPARVTCDLWEGRIEPDRLLRGFDLAPVNTLRQSLRRSIERGKSSPA